MKDLFFQSETGKTPERHAREEAETMRIADERGNRELYGRPDPPRNEVVKHETLADYVNADFAEIWAAAERKK